MILTVDPSSPVPTYEQIREQLEVMIDSGALRPQTRLPSIRQLATDLSLAAGTVARAYRELEQAGLVGGRGRQGTRVLTPPAASPGDATALDAAAFQFALRTRQLGVDAQGAKAAVTRALTRLDRAPAPLAPFEA